MNKDCRYCQKIFSGKEKVYEDEKVVAVLSDSPSAYGHIILMPKEHYPIMEQVPDFIINHIFRIANKISIAAFEALHVQGTNLLVNNGIAAGQDSAHFMIHIIPRREGDGLNLQWTPKQLSEEEMSTVELQLKENAKTIGQFQKEKTAPIEIRDTKEKIESKPGEESYLLRKVRRIP
ncbi:HIT family protein [Candidatus Woesearchaeota archaeon CG10_big_fil_rev_8_21_14_0_10_44_13]|nr:MAG: HIT family protein [Candidatus Woesearchaeota archaeon CG10_big_fil_rev_8_21_14_0_10_44_13]